MVRVAILANTLVRAQRLATLLGEDDRLEIVEAASISDDGQRAWPAMVDVMVTAGLPLEQISQERIAVVALTDQPVKGMPGKSIRACLSLQSSAAELAAAIVAAAQDFVVLTPSQAAEWAGGPRLPHHEDDFATDPLTARELQVLRMLADGMGNKEIAGQLQISDHTAKFHVAQILAKLRAGSRAEAVAIGMRRGLVPI